ncbi:porin family protein [Hymenobacter sp. CRA2]|uniref:porin family protein n=1 Tax=Hymenobacter sp. CRA2 TaxID=1955620 RepID=UPI0009D2357D|nr:porin family protein [Hymenobacter sp. CRA2]OON66210.1 hypothetical protein B0919_22235 [Hymenobacter sp. CRA2]
MRATYTLLSGLTLALLSGHHVQAQVQVSVAPRVGLNIASIAAKPADKYLKDGALLGAQYGVALNAQFGRFAVQPALLLSQKGSKVAYSYVDGPFSKKGTLTTKLTYFEVPLNAVYSTGGEYGLLVLAGPYLGVGLKGEDHLKYTASYMGSNVPQEEDTNVKFVAQAERDYTQHYARKLDWGINAGLGFKAKALQVQASYGVGLGNIIPNGPDNQRPGDRVRNRVLQFSAAYFFRLRG